MSAGAIWVPGSGMVNLDVTRLQRALKDYDERLEFGRHTATGDWCIFIQFPRGAETAVHTSDGIPLYPIQGYGDRIPTPEEAIELLKRRDTFRTADTVLREINAHNEAIEREYERAASEATEEAAERITHEIAKTTELNKQDLIRPVYVPGKEE